MSRRKQQNSKNILDNAAFHKDITVESRLDFSPETISAVFLSLIKNYNIGYYELNPYKLKNVITKDFFKPVSYQIEQLKKGYERENTAVSILSSTFLEQKFENLLTISEIRLEAVVSVGYTETNLIGGNQVNVILEKRSTYVFLNSDKGWKIDSEQNFKILKNNFIYKPL